MLMGGRTNRIKDVPTAAGRSDHPGEGLRHVGRHRRPVQAAEIGRRGPEAAIGRPTGGVQQARERRPERHAAVATAIATATATACRCRPCRRCRRSRRCRGCPEPPGRPMPTARCPPSGGEGRQGLVTHRVHRHRRLHPLRRHPGRPAVAWRAQAPTTPSSASSSHRHGGDEVKTSGDGFLLTFASPRAAVHFAVDVQDGPGRATGRPTRTRRSRCAIGVHAGEVERDGDDVVGRNVSLGVPALRRRRAGRGAGVRASSPTWPTRPATSPSATAASTSWPASSAPSPPTPPPGGDHGAAVAARRRRGDAVPGADRTSCSRRSAGRRVVEHAVASALAAGLDEVVVVTGAVELPLRSGRRHPGAQPDWADGMATSLQQGLGAAAARPRRRRRRARRPARGAGRGVAAGGGRHGDADRRRHLRRPAGQPGAAGRRGVARAPDDRRRGRPRPHAKASRAGDRSTVPGFGRRRRHRWRIWSDGAADQRVQGRGARRAGLRGAHRRRAHRAVHAGRPAAGDRGRRVPRHREGQGRPDHRQVQGRGHLRRATSRPPSRAAGRGPRDPRPGQRQRHDHRHPRRPTATAPR